MDKDTRAWSCDECEAKGVPIYASPCCDCVDGSKYQPIEKEGQAE